MSDNDKLLLALPHNTVLSIADIASAMPSWYIFAYSVYVHECGMGAPTSFVISDDINKIFAHIAQHCVDHPFFKNFDVNEQMDNSSQNTVLFELYNPGDDNHKSDTSDGHACFMLYNYNEKDYAYLEQQMVDLYNKTFNAQQKLKPKVQQKKGAKK